MMKIIAVWLIVAVAALHAAPIVFRPPAVPIITFAPMQQKYLFGDDVAKAGSTRYWTGNAMDINVILRLEGAKVNSSLRLLGNTSDNPSILSPMQLGSPTVNPTTTQFNFEFTESGASTHKLSLHLKFYNPLLPNDLDLFSRPVAYITAELSSIDGDATLPLPSASLYVEASAANCVGLGDTISESGTEFVSWDSAPRSGRAAKSIRMGSERQHVFSGAGDAFMLDWGYMYLATSARDASQFSAGGPSMRQQFVSTGVLPPIDTRQPRRANDTAPAIAAAVALRPTASGTSTARVLFAYDEKMIQYFYTQQFPPRWTKVRGQTFFDVLDAAVKDADMVIAKCEAFDGGLVKRLSDRFGEKYARVASLAYRQTFAGIELAWDQRHQRDLAFMKEISSDGDVSTMDVVFPASPLLLYAAPEILKQLLIPIFDFANNKTAKKYVDNWCPHHLGLYPMANASTSQQEPMPLEETANMFLMLLGYVQQTNGTDLFFKEYYSMMRSWAWWMIRTQLPDPPKQLCTDDFTGPSAHNANLAAKGVVGLYAFGKLCELVEDPNDCFIFRQTAVQFAEQWKELALVADPLPHSRLAFDQNSSTWSTKYNLLWQKILRLGDEPFSGYSKLVHDEVRFYLTKMDKYGFPLDSRFPFQKVDWMTWAATLSNDTATFNSIFDKIFAMADETENRFPLTDLYLIKNAKIFLWFRARPVVGAVFAPMLLPHL